MEVSWRVRLALGSPALIRALPLLLLAFAVLLAPELALARGEFTPEDNLYRLIAGPFGKLVMIFSGLGGLVTLYTTRAGKAGEKTPLLGVVMIIVALVMFALNVLITSRIIGFEQTGYEEFQRY